MNIESLRRLLTFVILLLVQVIVFNHIHLFDVATPLLYVYLVLHFRRSRVYDLCGTSATLSAGSVHSTRQCRRPCGILPFAGCGLICLLCGHPRVHLLPAVFPFGEFHFLQLDALDGMHRGKCCADNHFHSCHRELSKAVSVAV